MKNDNVTLAPVNTLPSEILAHVLKLSRSYCTCIDKGTVKFYDLAAVCTYWRLVALDTPALWSHVDVGPKIPDGLTQLLLERSRNVLVDVHAFEPGLRTIATFQLTTEEEVTRNIRTLIPHLHRVRALHVESYGFHPGFTAAVTNLWLDNGGACPPQSLVIITPHTSLAQIPHDIGTALAVSQSENALRVLRLLGTLHLVNIKLGWNSDAYRGLVDLRLIFRAGYTSIQTSEFSEILSASPALAILVLESLHVHQEEGQRQPIPRSMKYLSVLNLVNMRPSSLKLLLPLISLRDSLTETSVGITVSGRIYHDLEAFLFHSRVTTLYYSPHDTSPLPWSSLLHSFHLRTLIISLINVCNASVREMRPPHSQQPPSSRPPRVILANCVVSFKGLKHLITSHGIRELYLEECRIPTEGHHRLCDIQNLLLGIFPELECRISDTDSTRELPYRMLLDKPNQMSYTISSLGLL
ncbi:hypothetical protein FRC08_017541 [Ceratobasidium sp. 394]|nr:hypothetical protein FRC08_017541 [Ceratobasidium sp. 394]